MTETCETVTADDAVRLMRPYAIRVADRLSRNNRSLFDDLVQEGLMGAMRAVETFEPERGLKFTTYAAKRVHGKIVEYIRMREDHLTRTHRAKLGDSAPKVFSLSVRHNNNGRDNGDRLTGGRDRTYLRIDPAHHDPEHADDDLSECVAAIRRRGLRLTADEVRLVRLLFVRDLTHKRVAERLGVCESRISQRLTDMIEHVREYCTPYEVIRSYQAADRLALKPVPPRPVRRERLPGQRGRIAGQPGVDLGVMLEDLGIVTARVERVKVDGKRRTVVVYNCPHCGRERKTQLKHLTEWYSTRTDGIPICRKGCVKPEGVKS